MLRLATAVLLGLAAGALAQQPDRDKGAPSQAAHPLIGGTVGLDHVLLWSNDYQPAERFLEDKLGFRLTEKAGYYGAGISNKLIWFGNVTFIEFLWLSDPQLAQKEAPKEHAHVTGRGGSNSFGVQVEDADQTYAVLAPAGLEPDKPGGEAYDPDGPEGPKPAVVNRWRFMFLREGALPGNPFFVEYNLPEGTLNPRSDQPNGAKALSSVWVLVKDLAAAEQAYGGAHFARRRAVTVPHVGTGVALGAGEGEIFLLTPVPEQRDQVEKYGNHVVGMSIKVASLAATKALLEQRLSRKLASFGGAHGLSIRTPSVTPLGIHIEFHE